MAEYIKIRIVPLCKLNTKSTVHLKIILLTVTRHHVVTGPYGFLYFSEYKRIHSVERLTMNAD